MEKLGVYRMNSAVPKPEFATEQSACFDLRLNLAEKEVVKGFSKNNEDLTIYLTKKFGENTGSAQMAFVFDIVPKTITIRPGERLLLPTGLKFQIPTGHSIRLHPRSGLSVKKGLTLINAEGVIDADYVEEVFIAMINLSEKDIVIDQGERICQAELVKDVPMGIFEIADAPNRITERAGGFGSTGSV